ncbi:Mitochondrial substrate/solute carrier [Macleaya cordata]|nr:Mitochondrial substrate/solute carrier [Macleaya cordata]
MEELLKNHLFATHAIAAAGSVTLGTALTHPLDTLKTLIQVGTDPSKKLVVAQVLDRVRSLSGNLGLYSGFGWSTLGRISGLGARFGVYELLTAFYKDGREENYVYVSEALLAGIAAGSFEAFTSTPFELLKARAQVTSASCLPKSTSIATKQTATPAIARLLRGYTPDKKAWDLTVGLLSTLSSKHPNMVGALKEYPWMMTGSGKPPLAYEVKSSRDIISLEGWGGLWRSLRSGIVRDGIFGGVFFSTWQFLHIAMLDWKAIEMNPPPRSIEEIGPVSPLAASLAAGFSGSIAAASSHCFDTATSRSQCTVLPKYISMESKLMRWKKKGYWIEKVSGIHPSYRNVLFRGIGLRMARSGFASFAIVGSYFLAVDHLVPR